MAIRVKGRVQGVFFRAFTKEKADDLGVMGFVRNEPDGSVYIEAQADDEFLDQFIHWCYEGPPRSRVDAVEVTHFEAEAFRNFTIKR